MSDLASLDATVSRVVCEAGSSCFTSGATAFVSGFLAGRRGRLCLGLVSVVSFSFIAGSVAGCSVGLLAVSTPAVVFAPAVVSR